MFIRLLVVGILLLFQYSLLSQIIIDENFDDWSEIQTSYLDSSNDGKYDVDFSELIVNNDSLYLYINFTTGKEMNLQNDNDITLFIDIDDNEDTGYKINGIGADISYFFGDRSGFFYRNNSKTTIYHSNIDLITLPTVTSDTFELAIKRKFKAGAYLVNLNNKIKVILFQDVNGGDKMPDESGGFEYIMNNNSFQKSPFNINKLNDDHLRIMSYNVEKDHFFENEPPYKRLIKAIEPDILCFQEIYNHSSSNVSSFIKSYFGGTWYHAKQGNDLIVVSRYPIVKSRLIGGNGAFLINKNGKEILIVNAHLYCCDSDGKRQFEVDQIMDFIRDSKNQTSSISIKKDTPIIILGDMNFVGSNRQRKTLIEGDISNEISYGSDYLPDWDSSFFEDAKPMTTGYPATFTWNSDYSSYPKGRLDYIIYSGSVLQKENSYVLFTRLLDWEVLDEFQMNAQDSDNAADHFPVVVDFSFKNYNSTSDDLDKSKNLQILNYYPNPTDKLLNIEMSSKEYGKTLVMIYDDLGRLVQSEIFVLNTGENHLSVNASLLPQGMYFVKIIRRKEICSLKFIVK